MDVKYTCSSSTKKQISELSRRHHSHKSAVTTVDVNGSHGGTVVAVVWDKDKEDDGTPEGTLAVAGVEDVLVAHTNQQVMDRLEP